MVDELTIKKKPRKITQRFYNAFKVRSFSEIFEAFNTSLQKKADKNAMLVVAYKSDHIWKAILRFIVKNPAAIYRRRIFLHQFLSSIESIRYDDVHSVEQSALYNFFAKWAGKHMCPKIRFIFHTISWDKKCFNFDQIFIV